MIQITKILARPYSLETSSVKLGYSFIKLSIIMDRFLIFVSYFGILISGLLLFIFLNETIDFIQQPEVYHQVFHFGESSIHWKFKTDATFILSNLLSSSISLVYIFLTLLFLSRSEQSKKLRYTLLGFEASFILFYIYWYYQWYISGFDHF